MRRALSIAAAQTVPRRGDVPANTAAHLRLARAAAGAGAHVLVFPELSLTGYELERAAGLAFTMEDPRLAALIDLAAACSMTLIVGAPVRLGANLHIGAFILGPDRRVDLYTKHHLGAFDSRAAVDGLVPRAEATVFSAGDRNPLVDLVVVKAAVAICADTGRPMHARLAAGRGARIYLAGMFVIPSCYRQEADRLGSCAASHAMAVVLANYGGPSGGLAAAGGSGIWSEQGRLLARLGAGGAGIVVATRRHAGWQAEAVEVD